MSISRPITAGSVSRTECDQRNRIAHLNKLIGRTPLLAIHYRFDGKPGVIYAKMEALSFTGSVKDRMAIWIIQKAYQRGELKPGDTIVEASSGNTGIAFAGVGRALGHPVRIYMPNWMSQERVLLLQIYGTELVPVSKDQGGFIGSIEMANKFATENDNVFLPKQFDNIVNVDAHYSTTGPEIEEQLAQLSLKADAFVAGVGTGGTVMGVGKYLREKKPDTLIHPLEPANSPTLRTGCRVGQHRIQGISDEFIPSIVKLDEIDPVVDAWDGDSILMAQKMAHDLGLAVGISSGANFLGALQLATELGPDAVITTLLPDSNKKYLTTDLCRDEPEQDHYLTPRVEFTGFDTIIC